MGARHSAKLHPHIAFVMYTNVVLVECCKLRNVQESASLEAKLAKCEAELGVTQNA